MQPFCFLYLSHMISCLGNTIFLVLTEFIFCVHIYCIFAYSFSDIVSPHYILLWSFLRTHYAYIGQLVELVDTWKHRIMQDESQSNNWQFNMNYRNVEQQKILVCQSPHNGSPPPTTTTIKTVKALYHMKRTQNTVLIF